MAHNVFTVQFADGKQLFGIKEGIGGQVYRQLFETFDAAWECPRGSLPEFVEPSNALATQEAVVYGPGESWDFDTRASRCALWLTGPRDSDECESERPVDFGIYGAEELQEVRQVTPDGSAAVELECPLCRAVEVHGASTWPFINTDGVFVHSADVTYGVTCRACRRDFVFTPLAE
jgi:hypothetical protein